jgi:hypothetical protein
MFQTTVVENIDSNTRYSITFFFVEDRAVYEIMQKNAVQPARPQMAIRNMRIACWIPKATNRQSEYVIRIAFPPQQWLHKPP